MDNTFDCVIFEPLYTHVSYKKDNIKKVGLKEWLESIIFIDFKFVKEIL